MLTDKNYDIAVCGGGFAGVSAALSASRLGKKVVLFDALCPQAFPAHGAGSWLLGEERLAREKTALEQRRFAAPGSVRRSDAIRKERF